MHSDIVCDYPLKNLLEFHNSHDGLCTVMGTKAAKSIALKYGCIVSDPETNKMLHYIEHPETYVSDMINAGIYCFNSEVLLGDPEFYTEEIEEYKLNLRLSVSSKHVSMERGLLPKLVSLGKCYLYEYVGFWKSIKSASSAIFCNNWLLMQEFTSDLISKGDYETVGNNIIDPSSVIHPSAKIGPNVYIGPNVTVGEGARISNSIILESVIIHDFACILFCIISCGSSIGQWTRLEGLPNEQDIRNAGEDQRYSKFGITVFGSDVVAHPEIIIRNCIVMPHKELRKSQQNEIIL
eukprot:TRINITY_DN2067_c0_g7_i1.p1 TRINITY_DN2067_c0_g7~~TRINITY_DN2067_c0_g7_i1.p1  ORF type:complete len:294 (-),score=61.46 TRINITY_DN2067_c0_g7_i1:28-909(-)